jgi:ufm1-conjugating enzyme 1
MAESFDTGTRERVQKIPLLTVKAGPLAKELWQDRLKEELVALIKYIQNNKDSDMDWFTIDAINGGESWQGKCW